VNRTVVLHLLEKRGHAVVAVENGTRPFGAVERGSFDVVLMDVQMPEMDGIARPSPSGRPSAPADATFRSSP